MNQTTIDKPNVLLLDLDGTIFDTQKLKEAISAQLKTYTKNPEGVWEIEKKLRNQKFHLVETLKQFCEQEGLLPVSHTIQEIFLQQKFSDFIFPDFLNALTELRKSSILCIYTEGDESYQQIKIQQSGLYNFVDFTYIFTNKLQHLSEIQQFFSDKQIWMIDNHITLLSQANTVTRNLKTIWINRENFPNETGYTPNFELTSLTSLSAALGPQ